MGLLSQLREKPWLRGAAESTPDEPRGLVALPEQRIGLYVFLVVASSLFGLFTVSYFLRMEYADWRPVGEPWQLWMNTLLLLLASIMLQLSLRSGKMSDHASMLGRLKIAGWLTVAFVLGQLWAWTVLSAAGNPVASNPSSSFFFLITGVHGVHVVGGLVAWWRVMRRLNSVSESHLLLSIQLCTTYWHFLLIVWLCFFYMLLVT